MTRGLVLAAPSSGSGKSTVALALIGALRRRGMRVAAAKAGPDYIDAAFLAAASGCECRNLDAWAMRRATIAANLKALATADLVVCEGAMGLFDGIGAGGEGSTAALARLLGWPVVLVVDAAGMGASVAALVKGFARHRPDTSLAGVILNRVGSARHRDLLGAALASELPEVPLLGALPRARELVLPSRHLGLVQAGEHESLEAFLAAAAALAESHLDVDRLARLARQASLRSDARAPSLKPLGQRIAVARDRAFAFAYPAMLEAWRAGGATLSFFSPLADEAPDGASDAVFLPGGYPELHAARLAAAAGFRAGLARAAARGAVIYGECGGYMALGAGLVDAHGARHGMAGLLPLETSFAERRLHLGYRAARLGVAGPLGEKGARFRGHEFHYAAIRDEGVGTALFEIEDGAGAALPPAGRAIGTVMGSFVHLIDAAD
ncbi:MAG TPA: cobyrinate a,c-diamide synthase [Stellaceae bacterium]|nr:cobyrinate a,c-diamide synthase [Stellaceae bacterium]